MRLAERFNGLAGMERHQRVGAILAGVSMFAMAMGLTGGSSVGQVIGAIVVVAAFSSVIAFAVGSRDETCVEGVAGRIDRTESDAAAAGVSGRRAA